MEQTHLRYVHGLNAMPPHIHNKAAEAILKDKRWYNTHGYRSLLEFLTEDNVLLHRGGEVGGKVFSHATLKDKITLQYQETLDTIKNVPPMRLNYLAAGLLYQGFLWASYGDVNYWSSYFEDLITGRIRLTLNDLHTNTYKRAL